MNIDKNTILLIASATAVTASAVSSAIVSINARKGRVILAPVPQAPQEDVVLQAMVDSLNDLPTPEKLRGLQAIKSGNFESFTFHLRDI